MSNLNKILLIVGLIVLTGLIGSLPVWLLWNACLVPAVDGVHEIGWFQAWGLSIMTQCLINLKVDKK